MNISSYGKCFIKLFVLIGALLCVDSDDILLYYIILTLIVYLGYKIVSYIKMKYLGDKA